MASITYPVLFIPTLLGISIATIYTAPSTPSGQVLRDAVVKITNTTGSPRTVTMHAIPSGDSASDTNSIASDLSVPANDYIHIQVPRLGASGFIQASADADNAINVQFVSGNLFTP